MQIKAKELNIPTISTKLTWEPTQKDLLKYIKQP